MHACTCACECRGVHVCILLLSLSTYLWMDIWVVLHLVSVANTAMDM